MLIGKSQFYYGNPYPWNGRCKDPRYKDKAVSRPPYFLNENPYTRKDGLDIEM